MLFSLAFLPASHAAAAALGTTYSVPLIQSAIDRPFILASIVGIHSLSSTGGVLQTHYSSCDIHNHTSSERSTAQDDDTINERQGRRQDSYSDHPSSIRDLRHAGGSHHHQQGPPARPTVSTSRETLYHTEQHQGYSTPIQGGGSGQPVTPHVSYSNNSTYPHPSGHPPPQTMPQPPIATLESTSPTTSQPSKKRKTMYDPPSVPHSSTAPSPATTVSPAASTQLTKEQVKRTKTSRACDPCRRKKIR